MIIIIDNFFNNFNLIKDSFKNIQMFKKEEHPDLNENWPGFRSKRLHEESPFLFNLFLRELFLKTNFFENKSLNIKLNLHLRLKKDNSKDWVHTDNNFDYSLLVYLSETNLKSGTVFYDENEKITSTVNFLQNRAVIFDSKILHKSLNCYGNNINDGRLTLNGFILVGK
jgi:hypothetical protein